MDISSVMKIQSEKVNYNYRQIKRIGKYFVGANKAVVRKEKIKIWNENPSEENNWVGGLYMKTVVKEKIRDMFSRQLLLNVKEVKKERIAIDKDGVLNNLETPMLLTKEVVRRKGWHKTKTYYMYGTGIRILKVDNKTGEKYYNYKNGVPE